MFRLKFVDNMTKFEYILRFSEVMNIFIVQVYVNLLNQA